MVVFGTDHRSQLAPVQYFDNVFVRPIATNRFQWHLRRDWSLFNCSKMIEHSPIRGHGINRYDVAGGSKAGKAEDKTVSPLNSNLRDVVETKLDDGCSLPKYNHSLAIGISSLLHQFTNVKVRGDFLCGKFDMSSDPILLDSLDELRCVLQPRWLGGGFSANVPRCLDAVDHYQLLQSESELAFEISSDRHIQKSYSEWMTLLRQIADNNYWSVTAPHQRCTHQPAATVQAEISDCSNKSKAGSNLAVKPKKCVKIEEIVISDSEASTSSSSSGTNSTSNTSDSSFSRPSRKSRSKRKSNRRSVVTPPVFEMDGKTSLTDFLTSFEDYFTKKYDGNSYDQTQVLASFLKGDLLKIYEIRGGRRLKYRKMKSELLQYYKEQRIGSKKYWKKQLELLTIETNETYDMFGIRLVELAKRAYPNNKKECAQEVRKAFLNCLPPFILVKIKDAERASNAAAGSKKHLPFKSLMNMAKDLQVEGVKSKTVMWTSSLNQQEAVKHDHSPQNRALSNKKTSHQNERGSPPPFFYKMDTSPRQRTYRSANRNTECFFCHRMGHHKSECWRAAKRCLICGGPHTMEDCPRYDKDYRSKSRPRSRNVNNERALN